MKSRREKPSRQSPATRSQPARIPYEERRRPVDHARVDPLPGRSPPLAAARPRTIRERESSREAAEALAGSEEKYRTLFNSIDEGFCMIQVLFDGRQQPVDYRFLEVNPAFERHTGLHNAVGRKVRELVPQLEPQWFETFGRIVTTGEPLRWTGRVSQLGRDFDLYAFPMGEPGRKTVAVLFTDVTQRKQTEEALRRSETRLAEGMQVGRLGTFEHDHLTDVIEFSPLLRELFGYGPQERVTIPGVLERVVPEDRARLAAAIRRAHDPATDGCFDIEYRIALAGLGVRWVRARSQTFFEGQGARRHPVRTVGAVFDTTDRKEMETRLEGLVSERTTKLQELVGELEHFSYTITHDMRAPLRAMRGYAELAERVLGSLPQPQAKELLRRIIVSADRMDALIRDALHYNQTVRQELPLGPVDTGALLRGMLESYPELQRARRHIHLQDPLPPVLANAAGLTQCFSNLLGNAVKFVQPGQPPRIRVWAEPAPGTQPTSSFVRLWVEDQGIGIAPEMLPRVFEMFSRGQNTHEGTGIGLALVRKVVERMGGRVGVESQEGKGSRFWLELPAVPPA